MKSEVIKMFIDIEKEEEWLNDMSSKGRQCIHYSFPKYLFEHGEKGEYIYRIEFLEKSTSHPESKAYINFIEDSGVEHVASHLNSVYFRKKAEDGPFNLYTDYESRIKYFKKMSIKGVMLLIVSILASIINLFYGFFGDILGVKRQLSYMNIVAGILMLLFILYFGQIVWKDIRRVKQLKKDKEIYG